MSPNSMEPLPKSKPLPEIFSWLNLWWKQKIVNLSWLHLSVVYWQTIEGFLQPMIDRPTVFLKKLRSARTAVLQSMKHV